MAGLIARTIIYLLFLGKENLSKVVPSVCAIHLPKEAVRPALSLGIFRIRGDQVLGDVLQKTLAGAPRGIISESSSCHI